ncbi:hypothetical protein [Vibrio gallaecicus]|nr:hypothetical protein [Vibrio gallaecicus]MDN3616692.1 hypothetical protein [Vibrio gallaecicus]
MNNKKVSQVAEMTLTTFINSLICARTRVTAYTFNQFMSNV